VRRGVAKSGRQVTEAQVRAGRGDVVRDAERAITTDNDGSPIALDALFEPPAELGGIARFGQVQIRVECAPRKVDRSSDAVGARAPGPLVDEDGGGSALVGQGSSASSCSAADSSPVGLMIVNAAPSAIYM
jgi:hypothetical protein